MLKNYFKIAWRNLRTNKVSSFINIGGLAVGMTVAMLIGLWIYDELSYDKYHKNYDRIARVMQHVTSNGTVYSGNAMPFPIANELQTSFESDFKYVVMTSWEGEHILTYGDKKISKNGIYMDKDGPKMLTLKMVKGTLDGLSDMNSVLLSTSTAKAIFGDEEPVGKLIKIDNKQNVKVAGVYADLPFATTFRNLTFIAPWDLYVSSEEWVKNAKETKQWDNNSFQVFAQIADNANFSTVNKKIINAK